MSYTKQYPFKNEMQFIEGANSSQHIKMVRSLIPGANILVPQTPT